MSASSLKQPMSPSHRIQTFMTRCAVSGLLLGLGLQVLGAKPLEITIPYPAQITQIELGQGSSVAPDGRTLSADGCSLLLNGKPFMPIAGEFHYSRYPREEWRMQLQRLKAQGITVVSTYVFWIHHEESRGSFDWSGSRDLRHFVSLCKELGLQAIVRIGPWDHGEVRNGGLPDWVQTSGVKLRSTEPAFMELVKPFFTQVSSQLDGLYWKNGGPIVAIQVENECDGPEYLLALKKLARELGIDAPLYTMTGWNGVRTPEKGLLPLFGAYSIAFWYPYSRDTYKKSFFHTDIRDDGDMGAQFVNTRPQRVGTINSFPYLCCEIGGGMPSSYAKRIRVEPAEIAAMALVKLGNGSNMPGYYMYQGGFNPEGRLSYLHEAKPNAMPVKDYDFQAPLGADGLARGQAHLLRRQHLFIEANGSTLARLPLVLPTLRPSSIQDTDTVRWALRDDGRRGFLFLNNYQPLTQLPARLGQQFLLHRPEGDQLVPAMPLDIPSGAYGVLPLNLQVGPLLLRYATVDSLGSVSKDRDEWMIFGEIPGLRPELGIDARQAMLLPERSWFLPPLQPGMPEASLAVVPLTPSRKPALSLHKADGGTLHLVILPAADAALLHRVTLSGHEALMLSPATLHVDGPRVLLESRTAGDLRLDVFIPALQDSSEASLELFHQRGLTQTAETAGTVTLSPSLTPSAKTPTPSPSSSPLPLDGRVEEDWARAPEWRLSLDVAALANEHCVLSLSYKAEAARLYADGVLIMDNYFNGEPMEIPLWRIPKAKRSTLSLRVIPAAPDLRTRLPSSVARALDGMPDNPSAHILPIHRAETEFALQQ